MCVLVGIVCVVCMLCLFEMVLLCVFGMLKCLNGCDIVMVWSDVFVIICNECVCVF